MPASIPVPVHSPFLLSLLSSWSWTWPCSSGLLVFHYSPEVPQTWILSVKLYSQIINNLKSKQASTIFIVNDNAKELENERRGEKRGCITGCNKTFTRSKYTPWRTHVTTLWCSCLELKKPTWQHVSTWNDSVGYVITIVGQIDSLNTYDTILLCNSILNSKCRIKCQVVQLVMIRWDTITINTLKATRDLQVFLIPTALLTCFPGSSADESVKQKSWRRRKTYLPWNQPTLHNLTISKYFWVNLL